MENLTNISVIKDIFERHGFTFSKALGQNFIVNPSVCPKIAEMGNAKAGFGVIEIGTGVGVLTHELAKRADKVVAVEIDSRLIPILDETLSEHNNVKIINADVMQTDLKKVIEENFSGLDVAVCANLPLLHHLVYYNVSAGKPTAYKIYHRNGAEGSRHKALRKNGQQRMRRCNGGGKLLRQALAAVQRFQGQLYACAKR